jgi:hypothetical protein
MRRVLYLPAVLAALTGGSVVAAPISISIGQISYFLDNRGTSTTGLSSGLRATYGITAAPGVGTAVVATTADGTVLFPPLPQTSTPGLGPATFASSVPGGAGTRPAQVFFTLTNGTDVVGPIASPTIDPTLQPLGFVRNVSVTGSLSPTFSWSAPALLPGQDIDAYRLNLYDLSLPLPGRSFALTLGTFDETVTSFTLPGPLNPSKSYAIEISAIDSADGTQAASQFLNRSRAFFEFTPITAPVDGPVFIPTVLTVSDPLAGQSAYLFEFNITGVSNATTTFIDPVVALAYEYRTGAGNPNFAQVQLPTGIGDGQYRILLPDGTRIDAAGGSLIDLLTFDPLGYDSFIVGGIESSAGLDPSNPTAFVTGLRFTGSGDFTGTMRPLLADSTIPAPGSLMLLALGGLGLAGAARRGWRGNAG